MEDLLQKAVNVMGGLGARYADARFYGRRGEGITISKSKRMLSYALLEGVSVRCLLENGWGMASTTNLRKSNIEKIARDAVRLAKAYASCKKIELAEVKSYKRKERMAGKIDPENMSVEEKIKLTEDVYKFCLDQKNIVDARTGFSSVHGERIIVNSEGTEISVKSQRVYLASFVIAKEGMKQREFYETKGGFHGLELFKNYDWTEKTQEACDRARELLNSKRVPIGKMPVIFVGEGDGSGLLAHEAVGHAIEGDYSRMDRSFFNGMLNKHVASDTLSLIDDGTKEIRDGNGSIIFDDEGVPAQKTYAIKDGVFRTFLSDRQSAAALGLKPTGNARAQDQNRRIYVRMRNTYIEPRDWTLEEIIKDTKFGVVCNRGKAGIEDPAGGSFQLFFVDGWVVKNGELKESVYNLSISESNVLMALKSIDAIGKDLHLHAGNCGKGHEDWVAVGTGGPSLRLSQAVVGGA